MAEGKVEISINAKDNASKTISGIGSALKGIGIGILAVGAAAVGAAAASVKSFAETGEAIYEMSLKTGISTEALSQLKYAAEHSGTSLEAIQVNFQRMAQLSQAAGAGTQAAIDTLKMLGLTVEDIAGLSPEDTFFKLAYAIADVEDATQRAAIAQDVFGRSGLELLPMLEGGKAGFEALKAEAIDLGLVMSTETAKSADDVGDAMGRVQGALNGVMNEIAVALLPALMPLIDAFTDLIKALPIKEIGKLLADLLPPLVSIFIKLLKAIPLETIISFVVDALSPLLEILSPILEAFEPIFDILAQIIKIIPIKPFMELVMSVLKPLLIPALELVTTLLTAMMPILKVVFSLVEAIMKIIGPLLEGIANIAGGIIGGIGNIIGGIGKGIGSLLGFAGGGIVPGPIGKPRLVVAHGGEQFGGLDNNFGGGGGRGTSVVVNVGGSVVSDRDLVQFIRDELNKIQNRNYTTGIA